MAKKGLVGEFVIDAANKVVKMSTFLPVPVFNDTLPTNAPTSLPLPREREQ